MNEPDWMSSNEYVWMNKFEWNKFEWNKFARISLSEKVWMNKFEWIISNELGQMNKFK